LPQLAVVANGKAVRLVADALNQVQGRVAAVQQDALRPVRQKDFLHALGQRADGHVRARLLHGAAGKGQPGERVWNAKYKAYYIRQPDGTLKKEQR